MYVVLLFVTPLPQPVHTQKKPHRTRRDKGGGIANNKISPQGHGTAMSLGTYFHATWLHKGTKRHQRFIIWRVVLPCRMM